MLAANNSEMRVGSGTFLQIGLLTIDHGSLKLDAMRSFSDYPVPKGEVPLTGDFADRWGFLEPNTEWRNLGSSPQFPSQAELASGMWKAATGKPVDGVLALDVVALKDLLAATGPVRLDGRHDDVRRRGARRRDAAPVPRPRRLPRPVDPS